MSTRRYARLRKDDFRRLLDKLQEETKLDVEITPVGSDMLVKITASFGIVVEAAYAPLLNGRLVVTVVSKPWYIREKRIWDKLETHIYPLLVPPD